MRFCVYYFLSKIEFIAKILPSEVPKIPLQESFMHIESALKGSGTTQQVECVAN
jgi:hypothetical protein